MNRTYLSPDSRFHGNDGKAILELSSHIEYRTNFDEILDTIRGIVLYSTESVWYESHHYYRVLYSH